MAKLSHHSELIYLIGWDSVGFEPLDLDLPCGVGGCCRSVRAAAAAAASPRPPPPAPAAACLPTSATGGEQVANLVSGHVDNR
jgi:hypothetical protein